MQDQEVSSQISPKQRILAMLALCLATFMFVLDYTIANVAVPYIAGSLGTSAELGTYVITFFAVGNALGLPITGWLSKYFGVINTLIYAIFFFTVFSILCGLSQSLLTIVVFRFLQGLSAGPIIPLSQNCISMIFPKEKTAQSIAIFSMVVLTAPVFGPIIGGLLCTEYSWPWIFFINIPFGIFCIIIILIILKPFETQKDKIALDKFGFLCLLIGATSLQLFLDKGEQWDWWNSIFVRFLVILSILGFFYLYVDCSIKKRPLLNLKLWREPSYALSVITIFIIYGIYIATVVLIPFWLQVYMRYDAYLAGLAVCTIGILPVLFSILIPKLMQCIGCLLTIVIGVLGMALASFITMYSNTNIDMGHIAMSRLVLGFGILFWIPPIFRLSMVEIKQHDLPMALGMLHFFRAISGGIGTSIAMTLFKRRMIFHHSNLVGVFNKYNESSKSLVYKIKALGFSKLQTDEITNILIDKQASVLSMNDVFFVMGIALVIVAIFLLCSYKKVGHFR